MPTRRELLKTAGLASLAMTLPRPSIAAALVEQTFTFRFCLNTSTISGQNPGLFGYLDIASRAGYDGVELWVRDVEEWQKQGKSLAALKKKISDCKLSVENAIGFAQWMVPDESLRKAGMQQMKNEMEMMAELGCIRIAAPPSGVKPESMPDLFKVASRYKELIDLGRKTGVMPQLEFWGASGTLYHLGQALMVTAAANDPDVHILADVFHMYRGDSGFESLKMLNGNLIEIFHVNDFVSSIPREQQKDSDRVYPGDGAAPWKLILSELKRMGGSKVLSVELFNETYWKEDALKVAVTALKKMQQLI
ncbi:MAG: sugar phosphate isomerase/epimerase [Bacteroidales bacterium]